MEDLIAFSSLAVGIVAALNVMMVGKRGLRKQEKNGSKRMCPMCRVKMPESDKKFERFLVEAKECRMILFFLVPLLFMTFLLNYYLIPCYRQSMR